MKNPVPAALFAHLSYADLRQEASALTCELSPNGLGVPILLRASTREKVS